MKFWGICGTALAFLAVVLGAFAAHFLGGYFADLYSQTPDKIFAGHPMAASQKYLADFKTGVTYQFWHAIALLIVSQRLRLRESRVLNLAGWCFLAGTVLFSGSLYCLTLLAIPVFGAITPLGGLLFLMGWGALFVDFLSDSSNADLN